ncbi:hypothetical protein VN12_00385 [Pirellula sp. SH-Sr6A]|nr:hypothetical protein VN12_00385 [Pirellula sp. SH-Sr6A]
MDFGRRKSVQQPAFFIATHDLPRSDGHVFYANLNRLLNKAGFDPWIEKLCAPHYNQPYGRPGIPPAVYFRSLLLGYFEGTKRNAVLLGDAPLSRRFVSSLASS